MFTSWLKVSDGVFPKPGKTVVGEVENEKGVFEYGFFQIAEVGGRKEWRLVMEIMVSCDGKDAVSPHGGQNVVRWVPLKQRKN